MFALPAIVFYKSGSKEPVIYAGDIYEEQDILVWLQTQKDPGGDVIEDLEGERLTKMIEEHSSIAVFFCKFLRRPLAFTLIWFFARLLVTCPLT